LEVTSSDGRTRLHFILRKKGRQRIDAREVH
jgi:hypothetical protein